MKIMKKLYYREATAAERKLGCQYEITQGDELTTCACEPEIVVSASQYGNSENTALICQKHSRNVRAGAFLIESKEINYDV